MTCPNTSPYDWVIALHDGSPLQGLETRVRIPGALPQAGMVPGRWASPLAELTTRE